jgi:hypothetical protein
MFEEVKLILHGVLLILVGIFHFLNEFLPDVDLLLVFCDNFE